MNTRMPLDPAAFRWLLDQFEADVSAAPEARWRWLMAAHIVGQTRFLLHLHSHWTMLRFALRIHDAREAVGQVFRLALVPLGHAWGRLPAGNVGRATVSAFMPMPLDPGMLQLIHSARHATLRGPRL